MSGHLFGFILSYFLGFLRFIYNYIVIIFRSLPSSSGFKLGSVEGESESENMVRLQDIFKKRSISRTNSISEPTAGLLDQEGKRKRGKMLLFLEIASSRKTTKTRIISVAAAALDRMAAAVPAAGQTAATGSGNDCARTWTWPPPRSISSRAGISLRLISIASFLHDF